MYDHWTEEVRLFLPRALTLELRSLAARRGQSLSALVAEMTRTPRAVDDRFLCCVERVLRSIPSEARDELYIRLVEDR